MPFRHLYERSVMVQTRSRLAVVASGAPENRNEDRLD
jgi:hypothetical protein